MKFLNWMGITKEDIERIPYEMGRDMVPTMAFIGFFIIAALILGSPK